MAPWTRICVSTRSKPCLTRLNCWCGSQHGLGGSFGAISSVGALKRNRGFWYLCQEPPTLLSSAHFACGWAAASTMASLIPLALGSCIDHGFKHCEFIRMPTQTAVHATDLEWTFVPNLAMSCYCPVSVIWTRQAMYCNVVTCQHSVVGKHHIQVNILHTKHPHKVLGAITIAALLKCIG